MSDYENLVRVIKEGIYSGIDGVKEHILDFLSRVKEEDREYVMFSNYEYSIKTGISSADAIFDNIRVDGVWYSLEISYTIDEIRDKKRITSFKVCYDDKKQEEIPCWLDWIKR